MVNDRLGATALLPPSTSSTTYLSRAPVPLTIYNFVTIYFSLAFWAAALKGTMSCRTQGDFRLFVHSSVLPSVRYMWSDLSLEAGI